MTIVILAAGASRRMGRQKLLLPIDGRPMLQCVIDAAAAWPTVVVVSSDDIAWKLGPTALCIVCNDAPERGMSHSLELGNATISDAEPIAVMLGDTPDISRSSIASVIAAYDDTIDVVVPMSAQRCGHPVVFGPLARRKIGALPDGDTIDRLRDDSSLRRRVISIDMSSLHDIDTPSDYSARIASGVLGIRPSS